MWASIGMVIGAVLLVVGLAFAATHTPADPLSQAERDRIDAAASAADASDEAARPRVVAFLSDSYGEGTGSDGPGRGLADQTAQQMGCQLDNFSAGGTGYVTPGPEGSGRGPFTDRVADIVAAHPDIVIVAGGLNDMERDYSDEDVHAAVDATLTGLQDGLPDAQIVVVGPWWGNSFPTRSAVAVDQIVGKVAADHGLPTVSPLQGEWITGSNDGKVAGNRAQYIGADLTHPSQAGHDYLAGKIVEWLRTLPQFAPAA